MGKKKEETNPKRLVKKGKGGGGGKEGGGGSGTSVSLSSSEGVPWKNFELNQGRKKRGSIQRAGGRGGFG